MSRTNNNRLIVFAKPPQPGAAKTRLIPVLGAEGAAALQATLLKHTLATAARAAPDALELHGTRIDDAFLQACASEFRASLRLQSGGDLGARMRTAFETALEQSRAVVIIGCDCPALEAHHLRAAFKALADGHEAVFSPTEDGGYALIGLSRCDARLFSDIAWSTEHVMAQTRARLRELGWRTLELGTLWDVDRPADYRRLLQSGLLHE
jgi:rSAM/selenodomain-associated transferase 1